MCIRDRGGCASRPGGHQPCAAVAATFRAERAAGRAGVDHACLLYTSDAADERSSVDLGGRRIIKKKNSESLGRLRSEETTDVL